MPEDLRRTGSNFFLLIPDDESNNTLNGSTGGDDGIATTNFEATLWENGEVVAADLATLVSSFGLTIDNVSGTDVAGYKVNLTLPNRSFYELWIRHTTAMVAFRQQQFDLITRAEGLSVIRGNTRYTFNIAASEVGARNVAIGVLDTVVVEHRFDGAADFSAPNLVSSITLEYTYATLGDTNPSLVAPA